MKSAIGFLASLWLSFIVVMAPRGMRPTMPEFWTTPWIYGVPLLLAWPIYAFLVARLARTSPLLPPLVGALLAPLPFFILAVGMVVIRSEGLSDYAPSFYNPMRSIFTIWYVVYGILLGLWIATIGESRPNGHQDPGTR